LPSDATADIINTLAADAEAFTKFTLLSVWHTNIDSTDGATLLSTVLAQTN